VVRGAGQLERPRRPAARARSAAGRHGRRGGEYASTPAAFAALIGAVDCLQADATRCGGITGLLAAAALAERTSSTSRAHARRRFTPTRSPRCRGFGTWSGSTTTCASSAMLLDGFLEPETAS
jgi:hypothetical protein